MAVRAGDWVEVRSKEEILGSLDSEAKLEDLPFMPEMLQFCGQTFRVYKRAHKTCDTATMTAGRSLPNGVHLDLRCDGSAHGGCQAACLLFWKEAWLKPVDPPRSDSPAPPKLDSAAQRPCGGGGCSEQDVFRATQSRSATGETRYFCQATELPKYTTRLKWWKASQYLEDYRSGNITLGRLVGGMIYATYAYSTRPQFRRVAPALHWIYDRVQSIWGGIPFPRRTGTAHLHKPAHIPELNLKAGDLVRVKSYEAILATLDRNNKNKGLFFDAEMVPFCGGTYRVRDRVHHFIDEGTGKMAFLKTPAIILDKVWCQSRYSACRMFCPRSIFSWWREAWLEKVEEAPVMQPTAPKAKTEPATDPTREMALG
jgi:hypothetical protein